MIVFALLSVLVVRARSTPIPDEKSNRSSKFMRFGTADELFSEVLDDMQDPLTGAEGLGVEHISDRLKNTAHQQSTERDPIKTDEKIALYNQNTGKFELITSTSGHFMLPVKPVTENGVVFYGGQHYQYRKPGLDETKHGNRTGEIKIFWSSVTDAIENLPFVPVQVNVPDMISAMANFLSTSIPIINRFTNPNHPRLPVKQPDNTYNDQYNYQYGSNSIYDNSAEDRELKNGVKIDKKGNKPRKNQKRKGSKRKNAKGSSKGLPQRPFFRRSTETSPTADTKLWHAFGSGSPSGTSLKNMPISRKRINVRDREVFNFKNSDISNSPIMILNLPERPMMYHKTNIDQKIGNTRHMGGRPGDVPHATTIKPADNKSRSRNAPKKKKDAPVKTKSD